MSKIKIEKHLDKEELDRRGVFDWGIWEKEVSEFPWTYNGEEVCYLLEGKVEITPEAGETVIIEAGDFVIFPNGMNCYWKITSAIKKHFNFN